MHPTTTKRPWGSFTRFTDNEVSTVKLLNITKGEEFSLQYHQTRTEFWRVMSGHPKIVFGEETFDNVEPGIEFVITPHTNHRISAPIDDVVVLEISTGQFDEDDIVRLEDKYNRIT